MFGYGASKEMGKSANIDRKSQQCLTITSLLLSAPSSLKLPRTFPSAYPSQTSPRSTLSHNQYRRLSLAAQTLPPAPPTCSPSSSLPSSTFSLEVCPSHISHIPILQSRSNTPSPTNQTTQPLSSSPVDLPPTQHHPSHFSRQNRRSRKLPRELPIAPRYKNPRGRISDERFLGLRR